MSSQLYTALNNAFSSISKVLFGSEVGELKDYEEWLLEYVKIPLIKKNDKEIILSSSFYSEDSEFVDYNEINFMKKFEPLNINEIKDIDSIVEALKERFIYAGNIVQGKSKFIEKSTNVQDSFYVYSSWNVVDSKYVSYSAKVKESEYAFGTLSDGESSFIMKVIDSHRNKRVFEAFGSYVLQDSYYCSKVWYSHDCMFSFGLLNSSYVIGNLKLSPDKYSRIRNSLIEQMRSELIKNKKILSLMELISSYESTSLKISTPSSEQFNDKEVIEKAFQNTTRILLNRELHNIDDYSSFLETNVFPLYPVKSAVSNKTTYIMGAFTENFSVDYDLSKRTVTEQELREIGKSNFVRNVDSLKFVKSELLSLLEDIAFLSFESNLGRNSNMIDVVLYAYSHNGYKGSLYVYAKNCAYSYWPRRAENVFGANISFETYFAINSYFSSDVSRVFEVDNVQDSSDLYFSHNVENIRQGMFNFNVKNLTYAIGNASYNPETYMRIKNSLVEQIADELERTKKLKWNIYNIGSIKS